LHSNHDGIDAFTKNIEIADGIRILHVDFPFMFTFESDVLVGLDKYDPDTFKVNLMVVWPTHRKKGRFSRAMDWIVERADRLQLNIVGDAGLCSVSPEAWEKWYWVSPVIWGEHSYCKMTGNKDENRIWTGKLERWGFGIMGEYQDMITIRREARVRNEKE
jgi:hypothetical protein